LQNLHPGIMKHRWIRYNADSLAKQSWIPLGGSLRIAVGVV
jgi:hypothetical protein